MKNNWLHILALLILLCTSEYTSAQEAGLRDPFVEPHFSEDKSPERSPDREPGNFGSKGDRGNSFGGSAKSKPEKERTATFNVNNRTFKISQDAERRLLAFIQEMDSYNTAVDAVSVAGSWFVIFDLIRLDKGRPVLNAGYKIVTYSSDDIVKLIKATKMMKLNARIKAANYCELEWASSVTKKNFEDAKMWIFFRSIFAKPERFEEGGIKINKDAKTIFHRADEADAYRALAGFDESLTGTDIFQLGSLTTYLLYYPQSRDFIINADYIYDLHKNAAGFAKINCRDRILINMALLSLDINCKRYLQTAFTQNFNKAGLTGTFWIDLKDSLYDEKWSHQMPDSDIDLVGFTNIDLPAQSDLVSNR